MMRKGFEPACPCLTRARSMGRGISGLLLLLLVVGLAIAVVAVGLGIVGGIVSFDPSGAALGFEGFVYRYDGGSLIVHGAVHNLGSETVRIVAVNATYSARVNGSCVSTTVRMSFVPNPLTLAPNEVRELVASAKNVPAPCTNVVTLVVRYCSPRGCYESVATAGLGSYLELIQYVTKTVSVPITTTVYSFITRTVTIPGGGGGEIITVTKSVPRTVTETTTLTTTRYIVTGTIVTKTVTTTASGGGRERVSITMIRWLNWLGGIIQYEIIVNISMYDPSSTYKLVVRYWYEGWKEAVDICRPVSGDVLQCKVKIPPPEASGIWIYVYRNYDIITSWYGVDREWWWR